MTPAGFRRLLILEIVLSLAIVLFVLADGPALNPAAANEAAPSFLDSLPGWVDGCVTVWLLVSLVGGIVGMYRFKRWGRTLYLLGMASGVLLPLADGATVFHSGLDESVNTLLLLTNGALLALAYYSPLSAHFAPTPR